MFSEQLQQVQEQKEVLSNLATSSLETVRLGAGLSKNQVERYSRQLLLPEIGVSG